MRDIFLDIAVILTLCGFILSFFTSLKVKQYEVDAYKVTWRDWMLGPLYTWLRKDVIRPEGRRYQSLLFISCCTIGLGFSLLFISNILVKT